MAWNSRPASYRRGAFEPASQAEKAQGRGESRAPALFLPRAEDGASF